MSNVTLTRDNHPAATADHPDEPIPVGTVSVTVAPPVCAGRSSFTVKTPELSNSPTPASPCSTSIVAADANTGKYLWHLQPDTFPHCPFPVADAGRSSASLALPLSMVPPESQESA